MVCWFLASISAAMVSCEAEIPANEHFLENPNKQSTVWSTERPILITQRINTTVILS